MALTTPASGLSRPESEATSVDLPEPDGPMTMVTSPCKGFEVDRLEDLDIGPPRS
jgi:hypothetical protein